MEKEITAWILANWPSLSVGVILASVYIRLNNHIRMMERLNKRLNTLREVCAEKHADDAKRIYQEDD